VFVLRYASPWKRLAAFGVNTLLNFYLFYPFFLKMRFKTMVFDMKLIWIMPLTALIIYVVCRTTAPGKLFLKIRIVDSETGKQPTSGQKISRIIGYNLSLIICGLGFFWMFVNPERQTWHDKIAETVVVEVKGNLS